MNSLFLTLAAAAEHGAPGAETLFLDPKIGANLQGLIAQFFVFGLLAFALKKWAFDPIFAIMDERRKLIEGSLANADKIKKELAEAEATRKEIIHKANEQAQALIADAQKAAEAVREKKTQEAIAEALSIKQKAEEARVLEHAKMLADLRSEVAGLVVDTTAKVTGKVLTQDDQRRLASEAAVELRS